MSVLCRFSKFAKVSYKRKRNVRVIFIVGENMVRQYFSKKERQHISDLQKQHSGVKNSKENMKSVELPLSVAFNVTMPQFHLTATQDCY